MGQGEPPLVAGERIALRVGRVLGRYHVGRHFRLTIGDDHFHWQQYEAKVAQEAALDGLYVPRTNVPATELGTEETVQATKDLSRLERGFRCPKGIDLKVRPLHHHLADGVRAHIFLDILATYVEWHIGEPLAPLVFDNEDSAAAQAERDSIVAPARRSPAAERNARTQVTEDGLPLHSFSRPLKQLATLCLNRVRAQADVPFWFDQLAEPTSLERRAFALLEEPSSSCQNSAARRRRRPAMRGAFSVWLRGTPL